MTLPPAQPLNISQRKKLFIFSGIISVIVVFYLSRFINNKITDNPYGLYSRHKKTDQLKSFPSKEVEDTSQPEKKIFIAFHYYEQLTMATKNFLDLTALAAYGGRQVVVPFVKDSMIYGVARENKTLELYYNITALNHTLRSRGHGMLVSWKEFQDVCEGKLDVLVRFYYTPPKTYGRDKAVFPCNRHHTNSTFNGFKVTRTTCINVFSLDSVSKFEDEVVQGLPCVGIAGWRGISRFKNRPRPHFNLSSIVADPLFSPDAAVFFSSQLLQIARDFITNNLNNLGTEFVSVHIRAERILKWGGNMISTVEKCLSNLKAQVEKITNASALPRPVPVFLATDFTEFGSSSPYVTNARQNAKSLLEILAPLKPITFQPSAYNLTDRGAVAIVELNILASGKRLFVLGSGNFQSWVVTQFLKKNPRSTVDENLNRKSFDSLTRIGCVSKPVKKRTLA